MSVKHRSQGVSSSGWRLALHVITCFFFFTYVLSFQCIGELWWWTVSESGRYSGGKHGDNNQTKENPQHAKQATKKRSWSFVSVPTNNRR